MAEVEGTRPPPGEEWLKLADVAELLNIGMQQAYSLVRDGEIAAIQIGRRGIWRVQRKAVEDYVERRLDEAEQARRSRAAADDRPSGGR